MMVSTPGRRCESASPTTSRRSWLEDDVKTCSVEGNPYPLARIPRQLEWLLMTMSVERPSRQKLGRRTIVALIVPAILAVPYHVSAQPSDAVHDAYVSIYSGDAIEATRQFEVLRARDPQALPAWFGVIAAQLARLDLEESLIPSFEKELEVFITHAEQRYGRSRADAEALFYLAQAHMLRATYRFTWERGLWGAARDAARAKSLSDQYLKQHPEHGDAYLSLGLYNYYADIAPAFVKVLRVLLLLPSGSRSEGLKQIERASREGHLFAAVADGALATIYGTLENRFEQAIPIAERYEKRYPGNSDIRLGLALLYAHPTVEAYDLAAAQYQAILASATSSSRRHTYDRYRATLGLANLRRTQWRLDESIQLLGPLIEHPLEKPAWLTPTARLRRANYRMLLNDSTAADDAHFVLKQASMAEWHRPARDLIAAIESRRQTDEGRLYAALIPGNRLVAEDRWQEARAIYERVAATKPNDWQVRYRLAFLDFARGDYEAATPALQVIADTPSRIPDWLRAAALLNLAWCHDLGGRRTKALAIYKRIADDFDDESVAATARLGLIAPYRGPVAIKR